MDSSACLRFLPRAKSMNQHAPPAARIGLRRPAAGTRTWITQLPLGDSRARRCPSPVKGRVAVLPMVVIIPRLRMERPSARCRAPSRRQNRAPEPPRGRWDPWQKASNSQGVSAVMYPTAEIQMRQFAPQDSAGPSRLPRNAWALPLSSAGVGGAENAWVTPHAERERAPEQSEHADPHR